MNELNTNHSRIADKLMTNVEVSEGGTAAFENVQAYNAFLKTWQERLGIQEYLDKSEQARGAMESGKPFEVVK